MRHEAASIQQRASEWYIYIYKSERNNTYFCKIRDRKEKTDPVFTVLVATIHIHFLFIYIYKL